MTPYRTDEQKDRYIRKLETRVRRLERVLGFFRMVRRLDFMMLAFTAAMLCLTSGFEYSGWAKRRQLAIEALNRSSDLLQDSIKIKTLQLELSQQEVKDCNADLARCQYLLRYPGGFLGGATMGRMTIEMYGRELP